ncbi:MAG: T9SS type A sorting domain-containing protein [Bacteroidia bacterium]
MSVPSNGYGYQYAHTGVSYAGIYTYLITYPENRDYIQDSLIGPLIGGIRYYVTFYVSLADNEKYACNNIGAYFSSINTVFTSDTVINYSPQISNDTAHNPLTDKVNWMKVNGSFVAVGGEQYIVIGNFVDDAHVDTVFVNSSASSSNNWTNAYYYIDDVIVSTDSIYADSLFTGVNEIKPVKVSVKVYPNPATNLLNVAVDMQQLKSGSICLYNTTGQAVECEELSGNITTLSTNNLTSGLYYYRITDGEGNLVKADKIIILH